MRRGSVELIEAAYSEIEDDAAWLREIACALQRENLGVCAYTYRINEEGMLRKGVVVEIDTPPGMVEAAMARIERMPASYVRATWATIPCATALRSGNAQTRAETKRAFETLKAYKLADIFVINGIDPTGHGVYLGTFSTQELALSRREQATGSRVAAHLAAAYRLRRARTEPEAILTPSGRIEHAVEAATSATARTSLRDAALSMDRARSKRKRTNEAEAVGLWQALVSGRWTIVDRTDNDGRRYFIARKNDPDVARHHALTRRERQVVGFAALGHSNKLIAYEMGLSVSTVAVYLSLAAEKLGVESRAALIEAAQAFSGS